MKNTLKLSALAAFVSAALTVVAPMASYAADTGNSTGYFLVKGGFYSPSKPMDVDDINFGDKSGFAGEIAFGQSVLPFVDIELGAGYFRSEDSPAVPADDTKLQVIPITATAKALLPLGAFEPYGLLGIGAYITRLDVSGDAADFDGTTEITYGLHAGLGFNINIQRDLFIGLEEKYLWAKPEFDGEHINLDGFITSAVLGFRY